VDCAELWLPASNPPTLHEPVGCSNCKHIGYRGRVGIYELIEVDDKMRALIHDGASEQEMEAYVRTRSKSIRQDGIKRVLAGDTSLEEVMRVTRED
jgi:general secretion pathway protein E